MRKLPIIIVVFVALVILFFLVFRAGGEDSWIKDSRGVYVKHGMPSETPQKVLEQQEILSGALALYNQEKEAGMEFNSQCLGSLASSTDSDNIYVVDIVHVPRVEEDDIDENQCEDYIDGRANHFIELDVNGEVIRVK